MKPDALKKVVVASGVAVVVGAFAYFVIGLMPLYGLASECLDMQQAMCDSSFERVIGRSGLLKVFLIVCTTLFLISLAGWLYFENLSSRKKSKLK